MNIWLYVIISAALYAASFLWMPFFWWSTFLFLVPLFYVARFKKFTFFHGFTWGFITYTLQLLAVWFLSIEQGEGLFRFFAPGIVICWFALFTGFWFCSIRIQSLSVQCVVTSLFFIFINYAVLTPFFGYLEGYPFALPIVPIAYGGHLGLLPLIGKIGLLIGLVTIQVLIAYEHVFLPIFLTIALFFTVPASEQQSDWKKKCIGISHRWNEQKPYERAQEICHTLIKTIQKYPKKRVLILPESVFPWPLHEHRYAIRMWTDNALKDNKHLILGSYRRNNGKLRNTFYNIYQGRIIFYYDKTHLIPFFEKTNSSQILRKGNSLFLSTKESFTPGTTGARLLKTEFLPSITPMVCSETFWLMPSCKQAIALVNDSYFSLSYFPELMNLLAQMNALEKNTALFYCSWRSNF